MSSDSELITSPANPAIKSLRRLARRTGRAHGAAELIVEGPAAVAEALPFLHAAYVSPKAAARHAGLVRQLRSAGVSVHAVAEDLLDDVAGTVTPQGLLAVAKLPVGDLDVVISAASLVVVLHQIRDPGNAGAAIRTADAAGADAVVVTAGSVDPRGSKAVRASAGSLFHLPVVTGQPFEAVAQACKAAGLQLVAAAASGERDIAAVDLTTPTALVFGNEAHGLDGAALAHCDLVARVSMHEVPRDGFDGTAESLNLAATVAVVTFEAARQRRSEPRL